MTTKAMFGNHGVQCLLAIYFYAEHPYKRKLNMLK